eukprot:scaffold13640_cov135-Isochrysis_galbana.AAC.1
MAVVTMIDGGSSGGGDGRGGDGVAAGARPRQPPGPTRSICDMLICYCYIVYRSIDNGAYVWSRSRL